MTLDPGTRRRRMEQLVDDHHVALLGYARRRTAQPADAADVVCDVMVVAWRRLEAIPPGDEARLWLYGVARNVLANHHRSASRRSRLGERLRAHLEHLTVPGADETSTDEHLPIRQALDRLRPADRELLTLTAWEGLTPAEIATVLDEDPGTIRVRLHRARTRLRTALAELAEPAMKRPAPAGDAPTGGTPVLPGSEDVR
jgi:RNA polymerase sigma-70 factor, ECF subfamily